MPKILRNISLSEISFVDKGASGDDEHAARVAIWKRDKPMSFLDRLKAGFKKAEDTPTAEQAKEALLGSLSDEQAAMFAAFLELYAAEMAPNKPEEDKPVEMADTTDEEMKKSLESNPALASEIKKLRQDRDEMKKILDNEIAKRRAESFKKAADDMAFVPSNKESLAKLLEEADRVLSNDAQDTFAKILTASQAAVKGSQLLKARGSSASPKSSGDRDVVDAAIKKVLEKNPNMSAAVALTKAIRDPEVKRAYVNTRTSDGE